jgi:hypothetical protein
VLLLPDELRVELWVEVSDELLVLLLLCVEVPELLVLLLLGVALRVVELLLEEF